MAVGKIVYDARAAEAPSCEIKRARKATSRNSHAHSSDDVANPAVGGKTTTAPSLSGESYLTVRQVAGQFNFTVQTIWRWAREKNGFPPPVKVAAGMTRWRDYDVSSVGGNTGMHRRRRGPGPLDTGLYWPPPGDCFGARQEYAFQISAYAKAMIT